jgi:hypothetical protein
MAQFVKEFEALPIGPLRAYLDACPLPFRVSELYEVASASKFVDTDLRLSRFRPIVDPALFGLTEDLLQAGGGCWGICLCENHSPPPLWKHPALPCHAHAVQLKGISWTQV